MPTSPSRPIITCPAGSTSAPPPRPSSAPNPSPAASTSPSVPQPLSPALPSTAPSSIEPPSPPKSLPPSQPPPPPSLLPPPPPPPNRPPWPFEVLPPGPRKIPRRRAHTPKAMEYLGQRPVSSSTPIAFTVLRLMGRVCFASLPARPRSALYLQSAQQERPTDGRSELPPRPLLARTQRFRPAPSTTSSRPTTPPNAPSPPPKRRRIFVSFYLRPRAWSNPPASTRPCRRREYNQVPLKTCACPPRPRLPLRPRTQLPHRRAMGDPPRRRRKQHHDRRLRPRPPALR